LRDEVRGLLREYSGPVSAVIQEFKQLEVVGNVVDHGLGVDVLLDGGSRELGDVSQLGCDLGVIEDEFGVIWG